MKTLLLTVLMLAARAACCAEPPVRLAAAGGGFVSEADVADWRAVQACYGGDAVNTRRAGFLRMLEAAVLEEVLKGAGRPIAEADYAGEAARIAAETKAPGILACIVKYFGRDEARYRRVFVRPILAQRFVKELALAGAAAPAAGNKDAVAEYLKRAPKVPCRVNDKALRAWVRGIRGNPLLAPAAFELPPNNRKN